MCAVADYIEETLKVFKETDDMPNLFSIMCVEKGFYKDLEHRKHKFIKVLENDFHNQSLWNKIKDESESGELEFITIQSEYPAIKSFVNDISRPVINELCEKRIPIFHLLLPVPVETTVVDHTE